MKMKKWVILFGIFVFAVLILKGVDSQTTDYNGQINKSFKCLEDQIRKTPSLTFQQATFSMLAGAGGSRITSAVSGMKKQGESCWPKEGCKIKETAQVALAYKKQNKNNADIINWLKNQTTVPRDLTWYLQVWTTDGREDATCTIKYDGQEYGFSIVKSVLIASGSGFGNCMTLEPGLSWLRISSNCIEKSFSVGCNVNNSQKFMTTFAFITSTGSVPNYLSSQTQTSDSGGLQVRSIPLRCFKKEPSSSGCDYESTLWAATALYDKGEDIGNYSSYLKSLVDNNKKYFPEAFLINLFGRQNNYFSSIVEKRKSGHWSISGSLGSSYYDTALAILGLGGIESEEVKNGGTLSYLFDTNGQTTEGCWNNNDLSDTALILYSLGVAKSVPGSGGEIPPAGTSCASVNGTCELNCSQGRTAIDAVCDGTNELCCRVGSTSPSPVPTTTDCEVGNFYCVSSLEDCLLAGGEEMNSYNCATFGQRCCTVAVNNIKTCTELGGKVCKPSEEECSNSPVESDDGACCLDVCQEVQPGTPTNYSGGSAPVSTGSGGGSIWWIIVLLAILIIIVALAIVFRNKLRMWWAKSRGKVKTSKFPPGPPGAAPQMFRQMPPPRFGSPPPQRRSMMQPPQQPQRTISRQGGQNEREMEDTLKKLKKISEE
jgi:hypothetical protein